MDSMREERITGAVPAGLDSDMVSWLIKNKIPLECKIENFILKNHKKLNLILVATPPNTTPPNATP